MSILCNLQNINLAFGQKIIFDNAKFTLNKGDKIGLIGLNGQGKSTLFNILADKVNPDTSQPPFIFDKNKELFTLFYVPQEIDVHGFTDLNINNFFLSFYPELYQLHLKLEQVSHMLTEDYTNEKLLDQQQNLLDKYESLDGWNIENAYNSYLNYFELDNNAMELKDLSGGEQRKLALSIGLSSKANLILWDEPTNHLDVETIEKFEDELMSSDKTFMVISHDRYLLNHVTNRIIHIDRGLITSFKGTYLAYLEHLEEKEKERLKNLNTLENKHRRELAWMRQGIKARGTRSKKRVEGFDNIKSEITNLKAKSRKVAKLSLTHSGKKSKKLIELKDATIGYDEKILFNELNITLYKKDKIALIGPNGAGKTTLINVLRDQLALNSGNRKALDDLKVITFDQKRESLDPDKTPFEVVGDGQDFVHLGDGSQKHVMSYLENFLFSRDQIKRPIYTLSGGEKNRLQLAMFMKQSADLWIFDEPTNDLDIETIEILEKELSDYQAAVLIIGHDRAFLDNVCKTTWLVQDKKIEIFEGGYSQVAPYLHALELEKKLPVKKSKDPSTENVTKESKQKMSYKEKERWDVIEDEIFKLEESIENYKAKLAAFDFSSPNDELNQRYDKLNTEYKNEESQLEKVYKEWEELSKKEV
ncbi:MAG: ABC-F family ATP-binding cassette domain-containing protein [Halobacteriovoraceae bacterium]|jgi:ABC transport system ATP-binding/permease protein|nr:ABC-F family ATP-binding cassette domain-containing protein [Halobacteriovoraceae bacterium]